MIAIRWKIKALMANVPLFPFPLTLGIIVTAALMTCVPYVQNVFLIEDTIDWKVGIIWNVISNVLKYATRKMWTRLKTKSPGQKTTVPQHMMLEIKTSKHQFTMKGYKIIPSIRYWSYQ